MDALLSPYVRVALDYTVPNYWPFHERVIFDYELLLVKAGEVIISVEGKPHHCIPGDIFLLKPGKTHMMEPIGNIAFRHPHVHFDAIEDENSTQVNVNFSPLHMVSTKARRLIRKDILSLAPFYLPDHIRLRDSNTIEQLLFDIINEMQLHHILFKERCRSLMIDLLVHLVRGIQRETIIDMSQEQKAIERVILLMRKKLDKQLSLDELALEAGYCKSHISYLFKKSLGISPVKYHQSMRINHAMHLLVNSALPVTVIADLCGYCSLYAFSNAFKAHVELSPIQYRNNIHNNIRSKIDDNVE